MHEAAVFVAASVKDQCLLAASVASVGLSVHTSMQTALVRQQKAASAIYTCQRHSSGLFLWQRYKQGEPGIARALRGGPRQKKTHTNAGQVIRSVTEADVYI